MSVNKRYQAFISSTFTDLKDERQAALRAVLELDHMPAGMELFPAADDAAWQLIQDVINASDYYVLIIGGRYGSMDSEGLGFTEKEYEYAVARGCPVVALLHENPDNLPRGKTDTDKSAWGKLQTFRKKIESQHTCVYWNSAEELKSKVIVGLTSAFKRHPGVGWVRADSVPDDATLAQMLAMKRRIEELEAELASQRTGPPPGTEDLQQGDDTFGFPLEFTARDPSDNYLHEHDMRYSATLEPSWNELFAAVAPRLINETSDRDLRAGLRQFLAQLAHDEYDSSKELHDRHLIDLSFRDQDFDTCIVQLRALGLVQESVRKRSVHDSRTYWTLTPFGDNQMVRLRAVRRTAPPVRKRAGKARQESTESSA